MESTRQDWWIHKVRKGSSAFCSLYMSNWSPLSYTYTCTYSFPDKVRGVLNEGGLFGEREGWHLPGFDTSSWPTRNITDGLPNDAAGVGFFITTFKLDIPSSLDAAISFLFDSGSTETVQPYRALLFVNGWMMGKRVGNLGSVYLFFPVLLSLTIGKSSIRESPFW